MLSLVFDCKYLTWLFKILTPLLFYIKQGHVFCQSLIASIEWGGEETSKSFLTNQKLYYNIYKYYIGKGQLYMCPPHILVDVICLIVILT